MSDDIPFDSALIIAKIADLRSALKDPHTSTEQKLDMVLRNQEITLMIVLNDHTKTLTMWSIFRPLAWGMTIAVTGIIGLAIAGHISLAITP